MTKNCSSDAVSDSTVWKNKANMESLFNLPLEVVEMIVEQLESNPKTSVVDYYNWLKAGGNACPRINRLLLERVYVCNLSRRESDFVRRLSGPLNVATLTRKDAIPTGTKYLVLSVDEAFFRRGEAAELPEPNGDISITVVYHHDQEEEVNLRRIDQQYRDMYPQRSMRIEHLILIGPQDGSLRWNNTDGNLFDSSFYEEKETSTRKEVYGQTEDDTTVSPTRRYAEVTFLNAVSLDLDNSCLSNFLSTRQSLRDYFALTVNFPALKSIGFALPGKTSKADCLNQIQMSYLLTQDSKRISLEQFFHFYSLRNWNLPSLEGFSGHVLKWDEFQTDSAEKFRSVRDIITQLKTRIQQESSDGLPHLNAQLFPNGVTHSCIQNWPLIDTKLDIDAARRKSPLICLRHPHLESLEIIYMIYQPEGNLRLEGLYLPQLHELSIRGDQMLCWQAARNPMYHVFFSDWNDLAKCEVLVCQLKKELQVRCLVETANLGKALHSLKLRNKTEDINSLKPPFVEL
ncbi:LADA_0H19636g1_1 [Lachancea dasiensis]|uniref:LADA_0H19636g1_1 n=1 Tax=Lachancea dasiensis TaxID=1072105 RepID=A0A1G4K6F1_9SACH|nr:LADA_0H19636g1_1 [Lachancea dasiensis]